jgi:lysophospholipase L1-like esterase
MPSSTVRAADAPTIAIKSGEKIAFLEDSITQQGSSSPAGYVRLVIRGWETNGVAATPIPAGISGHKSNDMLKRLDRDVLSQQPDWMTLSCGVNDVWHGEKGVPRADHNADMQTAVAAGKKTAPHGELTAPVDGVHMNALGNQVMAASILRAFGLSPAQVEKTRESWSDIPATMQLAGKVGLSMRQYNQLRLVAAQQNRSVADLLNAELHKSVDSLLKEAADKN